MEDPVVPFERNLYGHPLAGLLWEKQFEKIHLKHGWAKIPNWECLFVHCENRIILICVCGRHKINWLEKTKSWSDVETTQQRCRFGRINIFPWSCILGMHSKKMRNKQRYCGHSCIGKLTKRKVLEETQLEGVEDKRSLYARFRVSGEWPHGCQCWASSTKVSG